MPSSRVYTAEFYCWLYYWSSVIDAGEPLLRCQTSPEAEFAYCLLLLLLTLLLTLRQLSILEPLLRSQSPPPEAEFAYCLVANLASSFEGVCVCVCVCVCV